MSDNRKLDIGDTVGNFEVTAVSFNQDVEGNPINFQYTIKDAAEVQADREAAAEALRVLESQKSELEV